jgi:hypothetical protein
MSIAVKVPTKYLPLDLLNDQLYDLVESHMREQDEARQRASAKMPLTQVQLNKRASHIHSPKSG